ncbi:MAG: HEPN domain-containing protein [Synergistaceae bacterium]|nr:HEPN domain-containing protein [Synergistaceae bacterium]MBQ6739392.1 HEPN domain-containing protein [Synergistaceae bacterium]MBQ6909174.1 HEPN domain-containing protein [Synergistaceae bacterium]MBQ7569594.1 HEPN domain-containing protein [Synergistaceae bacterium]MBR0044729.1 HEPN domain-containing protein [Synergistaceae bacterium]
MESRLDYSKYRLEKAKSDLRDAKVLFDAGSCKSAANRSYYAIFHAMRAVLALEPFDSKKHSGVIAHFHQFYIKSGLFDKNLSSMITNAFEIRNGADYEDFYLVSVEEIEQQIKNAEIFIAEIEKFLLAKWEEEY